MGNTAKIAMVVSDLDGTLILPGDRISDKFMDVRRQLDNAGILFTLATGRGWFNTRELARRLNVSLPVVVQSGALIIEPASGEIIASYCIPPAVSEVLWQFKAKACDAFLLDLDGIYNTEGVLHPEGIKLLNYLDKQCRIVSRHWTVPAKGTVKHLFVGDRAEILTVSRRVKAIYPEGRQILWPGTKGSGWYLEIFAPEATKAAAVGFIAGRLGIPMEQVMAFGDADNDRELITAVGWGCAVKDAPRELRRLARLVIPGPRADGVAKTLERVVFGKEEERRWKRLFSIFTPTRF